MIWIDDDGAGMTGEAINKLNRSMLEPLREEMGFGLWNVNQRIMHEFGEESCLRFSNSPLGGLRAVLSWKTASKEDRYPVIPSERNLHHASIDR